MSNYKHNIATDRSANIVTSPVEGPYNVQVIVGTAPVNQANDPYGVTNKPVVVTSLKEVQENFGWSDNFEDYTLMQAAYESFQLFAVAPIIMINVLDPANTAHVTAVAGSEYTVTKGKAVVEVKGILLNSLAVSVGETVAKAEEDYLATITSDGYVAVAVTTSGALKDAEKVKIAYKKLDPQGVSADDIIGGVDIDGNRKGIECVDEIYGTLGILPGVLSAPGYSHIPAVAFALMVKAELAGDFSNAIAVVDIESETTKRCEQVAAAKERLGVESRWVTACWPKAKVAGKNLWMSGIISALLQHISVSNGNIPCESPDNLAIPIDGLVLNDGTPIRMTQAQVNDYLNAVGVVSSIYIGGWKCWGNNTTAYPRDKTPSNRFIKCVMISNYLENRFKTEHLVDIGRNADYKRIDSIVTNANAEFNALTPDYLAGAEIIFDKADNPIAKIMEGHLKFRTRYADYTPIEYIENSFVWDSTILENALEGGTE